MSLEQLFARVTEAACKGGASEFDVATLRLIVLGRHELSTIETALRIAHLERQLDSMSPGERQSAICERLGIRRRQFYELKKLSAAVDRTVDV